ncbi:RDD family protein [Antrihabitans sp. YC3-6]|uniref:RDD family protein n=1 Tax=Antrihabitans stalagmiti TaxID=2799499 RepID=A0A934NVA6_9NOCA|nr:RDD family protein [Antrihabitans stalagmiti]MBJ8341795.1 RDD family protein [Antrihabitans stalagmiti]
MARITGSWLSGPSAALPEGNGNTDNAYRGEKLGLPQDGIGSIAPTGRRLIALLIDWLLSLGIAGLIYSAAPFAQPSTITLLVWLVLGILAVTLFTFTPGQLITGIQVAMTNGAPRVDIVHAGIRSLLLALVVPAFITDGDGRGLHDRLSKTVVLKSR